MKTVMLAGGVPDGQARRRGGFGLTALEAVANRPIVQHALDRLHDISEGGIVFVGEADVLMDLRAGISDSVGRFPRVDYVVCPSVSGLAGAAHAARSHIGEDPCLILPADGLYDGDIELLLDEVLREHVDLTVLAAGASAEVGVFGAGVIERVADALQGRPVPDISVAARHLAGMGMSVDWHPADGWHRYRGDGADLLELNRIALDRVEGSVPDRLRDGNRIDGRVEIDPTANVQSSVLFGPIVIGPNATIRDAYIGPYTSIGAGVRIEGAEIERSIISPGASVMHIGSRLASSLVGKDTRVFRDFSLPRALRLWVGEGDDVVLC